MEEYLKMSSSGYISCIRINGKPILPPLVDEKRKAELLHYKNLALLVEKKYSDRKMHENDRRSIDSGVTVSGFGIRSSLSSQQSELVESKTDQQPTDLYQLQACPEKYGYGDSNIFDILLSTKSEFDDATLNFLMNCCDDFCRFSFFDKHENKFVVASETNDTECSSSVSYFETLPSEKECPSSYVSADATEKCQVSSELGCEDKPSEKSGRFSSELERIEISCSDGVTDIMFTDSEYNNLTELCSDEQFTDAVVKSFQSCGTPEKNGAFACNLSLRSPDLHLIPPSDKLTINKSLIHHSVVHPSPYVTLRDNQVYSTPFEEPQSKVNSAEELFTSERNSDFHSNEELPCRSCDLTDEITDHVMDFSPNTISEKSLKKQVDPIAPEELTSLSGPSSADLSNSSASSKTVVNSQCSIPNISQLSKEKIYDPSLYDGKGTVERKTLEGTDLEIKISNNSHVVDEKTHVITDLQISSDPDVDCNFHENQSEGSVSRDIDDFNSVYNSFCLSKQSGETTYMSGSISASDLDVSSTLCASVIGDGSENSKSTQEPHLLDVELSKSTQEPHLLDVELSKSTQEPHMLDAEHSKSTQEPHVLDAEHSKSTQEPHVLDAEHSKSTQEPHLLEEETHSSPPRLLRQNSYTLEAPSPALLAHLKGVRSQGETSEEEKKDAKEGTNKSLKENSKGRRGWDLEKAKTEWKSDTGPRLVFAVSCNESQAVRLTSRQKSAGKSGSSLPGSSVSSPIKTTPCHSSLENISPSGIRKSHSNRSHFFHSKQQSLQKSFRQSPLRSQVSFSNGRSKSIYSVSYSELYRSNQKSHVRARSKSDLSERITQRRRGAVEKLPLQHLLSARNSTASQVVKLPQREPERCNTIYGSQKAKSHENRGKISVFSKSVEELFKRGSMASTLTVSTKESESQNNIPFRERKCEEISASVPQPFGSKSNYALAEDDNQSSGVSVAENVSPRPDSMIQEIFQQLQNQHCQLMSQLLDRQKKEQEALASTFLNQQRLILQEMNIIRSPTTSSESPCKSQSIETHDSSTQISMNVDTSPESNSYSQPAESHLSSAVEMSPFSGTSLSNGYSNGSTSGDNKQLFHHEELQLPEDVSEIPQRIENDIQRRLSTRSISPQEEKAATVINAAVRGYLTRRLFKTDHVQSIIKTISETVQCALQLQRECPGDITPSDIELHKRLIQQLTAACYSLHDTFFALSTPERMTIITTDRERLQRNQLIRPSSSISSATRKYLQRKQQQQLQQQGTRAPRDRPSSSRRSWWQSKSRASSGGHYEQTSNAYTKPKTQQSNRGSRRPWR